MVLHPGVEQLALCRAAWRTYGRGRQEGGSTVAMQLFRVLTSRFERSWRRKADEDGSRNPCNSPCAEGPSCRRSTSPCATTDVAAVSEQDAGHRRSPDDPRCPAHLRGCSRTHRGGVVGQRREFCGRPDRYPYKLFLQLEEIEHRTTKVNRPQSNGIVERFHRTLLDEHFRVEGRRTWFETIGEMQVALDKFLLSYNRKRPHQGRGMNGRTLWQPFKEGLPPPNTTTVGEQEERKAA